MIQVSHQALTLEEFLSLPPGDTLLELVEGQAVPKFKDSEMSPKFFHGATTGALFTLLNGWSLGRGRVVIEWAVRLTRQEQVWVPVPDLTYISEERLPLTWKQDEACPVAPELVVEIISPGQSFGDLAEKATSYITAGVLRVWIVDTQAQSITVFCPDALPQTYRRDRVIQDSLFPGLELTAQQVFQQARLV